MIFSITGNKAFCRVFEWLGMYNLILFSINPYLPAGDNTLDVCVRRTHRLGGGLVATCKALKIHDYRDGIPYNWFVVSNIWIMFHNIWDVILPN